MEGTVKWFSAPKGYGFITSENGTDYFAHYSDIVADGFKTLPDGAKVTFDIKENERGASASNIRVVG